MLERHNGDYFQGWLEETKHLEKQKLAQKSETAAVFKGFGQSGADDVDAWAQWFDYVLMLNEDRDGSDEVNEET